MHNASIFWSETLDDSRMPGERPILDYAQGKTAVNRLAGVALFSGCIVALLAIFLLLICVGYILEVVSRPPLRMEIPDLFFFGCDLIGSLLFGFIAFRWIRAGLRR